MQKHSIIVSIYAGLVLLGGIIGYLVANSTISLIAASSAALLLFGCSFFIWKSYLIAYKITIAILCVLLAFFGFRFSLSYQLAPAGIMTLMTGGMLIYLLMCKNDVTALLSRIKMEK